MWKLFGLSHLTVTIPVNAPLKNPRERSLNALIAISGSDGSNSSLDFRRCGAAIEEA